MKSHYQRTDQNQKPQLDLPRKSTKRHKTRVFVMSRDCVRIPDLFSYRNRKRECARRLFHIEGQGEWCGGLCKVRRSDLRASSGQSHSNFPGAMNSVRRVSAAGPRQSRMSTRLTTQCFTPLVPLYSHLNRGIQAEPSRLRFSPPLHLWRLGQSLCAKRRAKMDFGNLRQIFRALFRHELLGGGIDSG